MASSEQLSEVRRRDRAKGEDWIRGFITRAPFGHLASVAGDGQPFLNSNLFVYDGSVHAIYMHTARTGRTPANVEEQGRAVFSAAVMGRLLPAADALDFSVEYAAVVAYGQLAAVTAEHEKRCALELLMHKYTPHLSPGRDYRPITEAELRRTAVHRLDITEWSGKEKVAPAEFPGAFVPPAVVPPAVPECV